MNGIRGEGAMGGGSGDDDGPGEREHLRFVENITAADGEAGSGGEAGERIVEAAGHVGDIVEGQNVSVERGIEKLAQVGGRLQQRRRGRIDDGAQNAGDGGFAAAGRATEHEDGIGRRGAERGEEPHDDAMKRGAVDAEEWFELLAERGGGADGVGQRNGGRAGEEAEAGKSGSRGAPARICDGKGPALDVVAVGGNFDELVIFVGEMEEDGLRAARVAGGADAGEDLAGGEIAEAGAGGKHCDGAFEGVATGKESVFAFEAVGDPFAETARIERPAAMAEWAFGDDGPGVAEVCVERGDTSKICSDRDLFIRVSSCDEGSGGVNGFGE